MTTYRVVRQRAGGHVKTPEGWRDETVTVATVATGLSREQADAMVLADARVPNPRAGLPGYWLRSKEEVCTTAGA